MDIKCSYIFQHGVKKGLQCNNKLKNDLCSNCTKNKWCDNCIKEEMFWNICGTFGCCVGCLPDKLKNFPDFINKKDYEKLIFQKSCHTCEMNLHIHNFAKTIYDEYMLNVMEYLYYDIYGESTDDTIFKTHTQQEFQNMNLSEAVDMLLSEKFITYEKAIETFPNIKINIKNTYIHYDGSTYSFEWKWIINGKTIENIYNELKSTRWFDVFSGHPDIHLLDVKSILSLKDVPDSNLLYSYYNIKPTKKQTYPIKMIKSYNL